MSSIPDSSAMTAPTTSSSALTGDIRVYETPSKTGLATTFTSGEIKDYRSSTQTFNDSRTDSDNSDDALPDPQVEALRTRLEVVEVGDASTPTTKGVSSSRHQLMADETEKSDFAAASRDLTSVDIISAMYAQTTKTCAQPATLYLDLVMNGFVPLALGRAEPLAGFHLFSHASMDIEHYFENISTQRSKADSSKYWRRSSDDADQESSLSASSSRSSSSSAQGKQDDDNGRKLSWTRDGQVVTKQSTKREERASPTLLLSQKLLGAFRLTQDRLVAFFHVLADTNLTSTGGHTRTTRPAVNILCDFYAPSLVHLVEKVVDEPNDDETDSDNFISQVTKADVLNKFEALSRLSSDCWSPCVLYLGVDLLRTIEDSFARMNLNGSRLTAAECSHFRMLSRSGARSLVEFRPSTLRAVYNEVKKLRKALMVFVADDFRFIAEQGYSGSSNITSKDTRLLKCRKSLLDEESPALNIFLALCQDGCRGFDFPLRSLEVVEEYVLSALLKKHSQFNAWCSEAATALATQQTVERIAADGDPWSGLLFVDYRTSLRSSVAKRPPSNPSRDDIVAIFRPHLVYIARLACSLQMFFLDAAALSCRLGFATTNTGQAVLAVNPFKSLLIKPGAGLDKEDAEGSLLKSRALVFWLKRELAEGIDDPTHGVAHLIACRLLLHLLSAMTCSETKFCLSEHALLNLCDLFNFCIDSVEVLVVGICNWAKGKDPKVVAEAVDLTTKRTAWSDPLFSTRSKKTDKDAPQALGFAILATAKKLCRMMICSDDCGARVTQQDDDGLPLDGFDYESVSCEKHVAFLPSKSAKRVDFSKERRKS